ncbi:unnamed protein product [Parajaminaea phylloscopi]
MPQSRPGSMSSAASASRSDYEASPISPLSPQVATTPGSNSQAFIYPIRSAVSVKPQKVKRRPSEGSLASNSTAAGGGTASLPDSKAQRPGHHRGDTRSSYGFGGPFSPTRDSREPRDDSSNDESEMPADAGSKRSEVGNLNSYEARSVPDPPRLPLNGPDTEATESFDDEEKAHIEQMTQMRFKHIETEDGHMVLTGRDGVLHRCEDEPIHIPGAVQSFGCMVVIREEEEGRLVVRQASENTSEIIGMSPKFLFGLVSFLDCLEDDQADALWDNIETLEEKEEELVESGPQVFQLSGFGQPGPGTGKAKARMHWQCWCAAHRSLKASTDGRPVTILEFEPVYDVTNPLITASPPGSPIEENAAADSQSTASSSIATIDSDGTTKWSAAHSIMSTKREKGGLDGMPYIPTVEQIQESTIATSKPIKALSRLRRKAGERVEKRQRPRRGAGSGGGPAMPQTSAGATTAGEDATLDMFGILTQINEQLSAQNDLQSFLKVVVSIVRDLTEFSRVMIYQFDPHWNGQVVCELVNIRDTHDLYRGLNFPATDIPKQARDLYRVNKIRLLYDRDLPTARMVCRDQSDLDSPVDMTHSFLRAMSPIHIKYLANMGVRASMSCSIMAFNQLWGLVALHTYGDHGQRVAFPMRQLLRLVSDSVSRNIERLSYTRRLQSRKLINTLPTNSAPSGYILTKAEDLLELFDADFGVIAIGNECKILGSMTASQEILALTEYLRLKAFTTTVSTSNTSEDFPDMSLPEGLDLELLSGVLCIPLSETGADFIVFIRRAQTRTVSWAGKPFKTGKEGKSTLEPRKSFKLWNETVTGTCRAWTDEELETASVLCLVYGKFISVWRSKEAAMQVNQLNRLLLSNASHEVRTPLHHLVSYLELALESPLDDETRENLNRGRIASKSLLFTINDLLDISRAEEGKQLFLKEPFDLAETVREAVEMHEWEAKRRKISFHISTRPQNCIVMGDKNRLRQVLVNTTTNSLRHTEPGGKIVVEMRRRKKDEASLNIPDDCDVEIELSVTDSGSGIAREKLEAIFREFEQVESVIPETRDEELSGVIEKGLPTPSQEAEDDRLLGPEGPSRSEKGSGLGVGLAVVARIVRNLKGQLRVDSTVGMGSRFTYLIPFQLGPSASKSHKADRADAPAATRQTRSNSQGSVDTMSSGGNSELDSLVEAIGGPLRIRDRRRSADSAGSSLRPGGQNTSSSLASALANRIVSGDGVRDVKDSGTPLRPSKIDPHALDAASNRSDDSTKQRPGIPTRKSADSSASKTATSDVSAISHSRLAALRRSQNSPRPVMREKVAHLRVLVVEDDPINRMILKKRLGMDGHTVLQAMNGEEGVQKFDKSGDEIDCILMDLQMPICNGQDACKRIRELEEGRASPDALAGRPPSHVLNGRVPIFAVSATLSPDMREEMSNIGMDGWILKPVDFGRLNILLRGIADVERRKSELWSPGKNWEKGGWLCGPPDPSARP